MLSWVKKFLVDGGYSGERFAGAVKELCGAEVEVVKRNELHKFVVLPRRWVVERLFAWLDKFRRLWKNCERKLHTSMQVVAFALLAILLASIVHVKYFYVFLYVCEEPEHVWRSLQGRRPYG